MTIKIFPNKTYSGFYRIDAPYGAYKRDVENDKNQELEKYPFKNRSLSDTQTKRTHRISGMIDTIGKSLSKYCPRYNSSLPS